MSSSTDSDTMVTEKIVVKATVHASLNWSPPKRRVKWKLTPNEQLSDVPPKLVDEFNIEKPFDRDAYFNDLFDSLATKAKSKSILRQPQLKNKPKRKQTKTTQKNNRKLILQSPELFDEIRVMEAGNNELVDELNIDTNEKPFDKDAYFNDVFDGLAPRAKTKYNLRQPLKVVKTNRLFDFDSDGSNTPLKRKPRRKQTKTIQSRKVRFNEPVLLRHDDSESEKCEWPDLCIEPESKRPKSDSSLNITPEKLPVTPLPEVNFLSKEKKALNESLQFEELPVMDDLFDGEVFEPLRCSTRNKNSTSFMETEQCESSSPPRRAIDLSIVPETDESEEIYNTIKLGLARESPQSNEISPMFQVLQNITISPPNVENKEPAEVMFTSAIQYFKEVLPHMLSLASSEELKKKISTLNDVVSKF